MPDPPTRVLVPPSSSTLDFQISLFDPFRPPPLLMKPIRVVYESADCHSARIEASAASLAAVFWSNVVEPPMMMSSAAPPSTTSFPLSPTRMLRPEPPWIVSAPVPPIRMLPRVLPVSVLPKLLPLTFRMLAIPPVPVAIPVARLTVTAVV